MKTVILILWALCPYGYAIAKNPKLLVLVDGFADYLSGQCKRYCEEKGIEFLDTVSPYSCSFLASQGQLIPEHLQAPVKGAEIEWAEDLELTSTYKKRIYVISESDSGVSTAERIQAALNLRGNGICPQLRDKYLMNVNAKKAGLATVRQITAKTWPKVEKFLEKIWKDEKNPKCVIKPVRGVASDGVHLCTSLETAKKAFESMIGKPQFGGGIQQAVVVQEFADGPEFAIDTVSRNGVTKIIALWKYDKIPVNGAPFVYQCTRLTPASGKVEKEVCDYCVEVLKANGVQWGPTHTEVKFTRDGPRLIEINARWHAANVAPVTRACLGFDSVKATMDAVFDPATFELIPEVPSKLKRAGMVLHLISYQEGIVEGITHIEEIQKLPSVQLLDVSVGVGDKLVKTRDIRTDCGYVLLVHPDPKVLAEDYARIVELQKTMFVMKGAKKVVEKTDKKPLKPIQKPKKKSDGSEKLKKDTAVKSSATKTVSVRKEVKMSKKVTTEKPTTNVIRKEENLKQVEPTLPKVTPKPSINPKKPIPQPSKSKLENKPLPQKFTQKPSMDSKKPVPPPTKLGTKSKLETKPLPPNPLKPSFEDKRSQERTQKTKKPEKPAPVPPAAEKPTSEESYRIHDYHTTPAFEYNSVQSPPQSHMELAEIPRNNKIPEEFARLMIVVRSMLSRAPDVLRNLLTAIVKNQSKFLVKMGVRIGIIYLLGLGFFLGLPVLQQQILM